MTIHYNSVALESRIIAMMTTAPLPDSPRTQLHQAIAARAGVKSGRVPVFFSVYEMKPPTLQRVHPRNLKEVIRGKGPKHGRTERRVIVGKDWLRINAPELWAVFCTARLNGETLISTLTRN